MTFIIVLLIVDIILNAVIIDFKQLKPNKDGTHSTNSAYQFRGEYLKYKIIHNIKSTTHNMGGANLKKEQTHER